MEINYFDIAALVIFLFFSIRGAMNGFIGELSGFVGIIAGFFLAQRYATEVAEYLKPYLSEQWLVPAAFALIFFVAIVAVALIGYFLQSILKFLFLGFVNNALGFLVGAMKAYVLCVIIAYGVTMSLGDHPQVTSSILMPYLQTGLSWVETISPL